MPINWLLLDKLWKLWEEMGPNFNSGYKLRSPIALLTTEGCKSYLNLTTTLGRIISTFVTLQTRLILSFDITSANTFFLKFPLYHPSVGWKSLGNQPEIYQLSWFLIKIKIYYIGFVFFNGTKLWIGSLSLTNYFAS